MSGRVYCVDPWFCRESNARKENKNSVRESRTHTPTVATYTHAYTPPDTPMDCIRSLKAVKRTNPSKKG